MRRFDRAAWVSSRVRLGAWLKGGLEANWLGVNTSTALVLEAPGWGRTYSSDCWGS